MKKSLLAVAAIGAFASAAQAQSSVSIYGVMDVGIGSISNANQNSTTASGKTWTGMTTGNEATSRLGFKGAEDFGGGTKANFVLETQLFPTTGEAGSTALTTTTGASSSATAPSGAQTSSSSVAASTLFDRQATIGIENASFGKADLGRQNMVAYDRLVAFDPRSYGNFAGLGSMGINKFSRMDNSIKYQSPTFAGLSLGAFYSTANSASSVAAGSTKEIFADYKLGDFKATAGYSVASVLCNGTASTSPANTAGTFYPAGYCTAFGSTDSSTVSTGSTGFSQTMAAASYDYQAFGFKAGYLSVKNAAANQNSTTRLYAQAANTLAWGGVSYKINPMNTVTAAYYNASSGASQTSALETPKSSMIALDYQYAMSKRTTLYAIAGFMMNNSTAKASISDNGKVSANNSNTGLVPPTGSNQNGGTIGIKHVF